MVQERLGPDAWVRAGLAALVEGGVAAVRVEPLAARLGVTKGSFYWHFADRGALERAMVEAWEQRSTLSVIDEVEARGGTPAERLHELLRISASGKADRVEAAMRAWGAVDPNVGKAVARVDGRRERFVIDLFEAAGLTRKEATVRTRILYLALVGEYSRTSHGAPSSPKETWTSLERLLLER